MLETLLSWLWMFVSFYLVGLAGLCLLNGKEQVRKVSLDVILVFGMCFLTVYAQFFSLFARVSLEAVIVVGAGCAVILFGLRRLIAARWKSGCAGRRCVVKICFIGVVSIIVSLMLTQGALHYDTYLYHAQSIRWIEEYGVAPGIGNLHNRLAYNSSFFCLQALYSFHFMDGSSMFSLNGFITVLLLSYAVCSVKAYRVRKFFVSDFLRLALVLYMVNRESSIYIGSPGTDLLALGLVMYILVKWVDYQEEGQKDIDFFAQLCLLAAYAVSVKLSAAMVVLLVITPAVWLIRKKSWKEIAKYLVSGFLIVLPWLVRNVMISGYLLYPYPELDLFHVDWKMPEYTLLFDRNEIKVWGWGLKDIHQAGAPMREWLPFWFEKMQTYGKVLFCINLFLVPLAAVIGVVKGVMSKRWDYLQIVSVIAACDAVWLFGAPLPRYGEVYMTLLPLYFLGCAAAKMKENLLVYAVPCILVVLTGYTIYTWTQCGLQYDMWKNHRRVYTKYAEYECEGHEMGEDIIVYIPVAGDQGGYYDFPSTPYGRRLDLIELRGDSLKDGFRMKEEYRDAYVSTYGEVTAESQF